MFEKTANSNVKKVSSNSGVQGNHRSKTVKIRGVNLAALSTPSGPHEHKTCLVTDELVQPVRLYDIAVK
jgi:hypothetical protein